MPEGERYMQALSKALATAPKIEVEVDPMTGVAVAPFPEWIFGEGVQYGIAIAKQIVEKGKDS